jgi:riboflavin kinase / FMN adenylyltransferase
MSLLQSFAVDRKRIGKQILDTFYEIKPGLLNASSLALGFFDGVHPGHQVVIRAAVEQAQRLGITPAVVTFKDHPRSRTLGKSPPLLTLIDRRLELLEQLGIRVALVLTFSRELCRLSPEEYVQTVLVQCMGARWLSVGFNHRFGRHRVGDQNLLRTLGERFGYKVQVAEKVLVDGTPISSSRIRDAVIQGDVAEAARLLTRPFSVAGTVMHGEGRGRELGFPTANIDVVSEQVIPAQGVYSGLLRLPEGTRFPCVANIGSRPTFGDDKPVTTEVHVLDYHGDLYGRQVMLEFLRYLRPEQKFTSAAELTAQISRDAQAARRYFAGYAQDFPADKLAAEQH